MGPGSSSWVPKPKVRMRDPNKASSEFVHRDHDQNSVCGSELFPPRQSDPRRLVTPVEMPLVTQSQMLGLLASHLCLRSSMSPHRTVPGHHSCCHGCAILKPDHTLVFSTHFSPGLCCVVFCWFLFSRVCARWTLQSCSFPHA